MSDFYLADEFTAAPKPESTESSAPTSPKETEPVVSAKDLDAYTGHYYSSELEATYILRSILSGDGNLTYHLEFSPVDVQLVPTGPDEWYARRAQFAFVRDPNDRVTGLNVSSRRIRKSANPLEALVANNELNTAILNYEAVTNALDEYNKEVKAANISIEVKRKEALDADVKTIESELIVLGLGKKRHETKVSSLCGEYVKLTGEKEKLDDDKNKAKTALDSHADKRIGDYESTINSLLQGFGGGFRLTGSKKSYVGGTPVSEYKILIKLTITRWSWETHRRLKIRPASGRR